MPGPTVEELMKAGGKRRAPPKVGMGETAVNTLVGWVPGGNRIVDALSAGALELGSSGGERATLTPQARAELEAMGEEVATPEGLLERYRQVRDRRRERTELGQQQNPGTALASNIAGFGLMMAAPLPKFAGKGLVPSVKTGAAYGAAHGATDGEADLTRGEFGQALVDTAKGAAFGGAAGAAGHGLMRLGQKGVQALRNARSDVLAQETAAVRKGAEEAQAAAAKVGEKERKMIGSAREMNKARDARAARAASREQALLERAKRRGQPAGEPKPQEEPSTKVLEGMRGKAFERQQNRSDKALGYRRSMGDPDVDTQLASARQDFIDQAPEALNNPAALRRQYMERFLRQKYGDEMAERIMKERVGPGGEILPRGGAAPASVADDAAGALPAQPPALGPRPSIRQDIKGMPYGRNLLPEEPPTLPATQSMVAPRDVTLAPPPPPPSAAPVPPAGTVTAPLRPAVRPPPDPLPLDDATRVAGPADAGALAGERAAARERGALTEQAWNLGESLPVVGPAVKATKEMLRDPALRARVLSIARLHLLERINPALFARVGGTLAAAAAQGDSQYRARKYLEMRRNPELRVAEAKAAEEAARLSDDQLMGLIANGALTSP